MTNFVKEILKNNLLLQTNFYKIKEKKSENKANI